jgi:hypothetical protein
MDRGRLLRGLIFGAAFAIIGIGLFVFLYTSVLAGMANPARLFTAFFAPILLIGLLVIGYRWLLH